MTAQSGRPGEVGGQKRVEMDALDSDSRALRLQMTRDAVKAASSGEWSEALAINQRITERFAPTADDYKRLGKAYMETGELKQATDSYQRALELAPGDEIASKNLKRIGQREWLESVQTARLPAGDAQVEPPAPQYHGSKAERSLDVNTRVRIASSQKTGIVTEVLPDNQYRVFVSEHEQPIISGEDLEAVVTQFGFVTPREFLRDLLLFKLRRPLSDTLYSLSMSRTNFEVYQFKPAVKFLRNPNGRILIADEVGLGKTIEACIIYLELKARMQGDLPRVLVVCPAVLRPKWKSEFSSRFNEEFEIMDSQRIGSFLSSYESSGPATRLRGICSLEGLRRVEIVNRIAEVNAQFDVIVIDEAHHMRNPEARGFDLGEVLSAHADSLIMLTATPVQLRSSDLFYILNILDPGQFDNQDAFDYQLEPNRLINRAIAHLSKTPPEVQDARGLVESCRSYVKDNPFYDESVRLLDQLKSSDGMRDSREQVIEAIRNLHQASPFSLVFNRTRRREVMKGAVRQALVVNVDLTPVESEIYLEALKFARARAQHKKGYASVLGLIQIERQIASSIGAFREIIEDFQKRRPYEAQVESSSTDPDYVTRLPRTEVYDLCEQLQGLYLSLGETDSKFDRFYAELSKLLRVDEQKKVIVYSFFRKTLKYLDRRLTELGHRIEVIHGGKKPKERQAIIDRFSEDAETRILLSSEVGAEGLDMQFCDTIVNYDLPWNPMRVEQRIGRIDRYGQKSNKVTIVSFFLNDTIEERILQRLYSRIGVFEESIGGLEAILGNVERELPYEVLSRELSQEQEQERAENYLNMLANRRREAEEFQQSKYELIGNDAIFSQEVESCRSSGRYVSANEIRALVSEYLESKCPDCRLERVERSEDVWSLFVGPSLAQELSAFLNRKGTHPGGEDWQFLKTVKSQLARGGRYVQSSSPRIATTFSGEVALRRPLLEFVTASHTLVRLAFGAFSRTGLSDPEARMVKIKAFAEPQDETGLYAFFLFYVATRAIVDSHELQAVVVDMGGNVDTDLSERFLKVLQDNLSEDSTQLDVAMSQDIFDRLKQRALQMMSTVKRQKELSARQRNDALLANRRSAFERTYEVKRARVAARLEKARDERIIRMHQGEIRNLQSKLQSTLEELETKRRVSVSYEPVAQGLVELCDAQTATTVLGLQDTSSS